jgi:hypothetical protein
MYGLCSEGITVQDVAGGKLMNVRVTMMDMELEFAIHQMTGKQL